MKNNNGFASVIIVLIVVGVLVLGGGYGTRLFDKLKLPNYTPKGLIQIN
ncbi:MAG: hypothetical protein US98_C0005G0001, partial [Parcubacteria group bacterium GW2011_GWC1_38_6]